MEAAAISNMVSPHVVELVQSGDISQILSDVMGGASNATTSSGAGVPLPVGPEDADESGIAK
jgi:hypothetical protein